VTIVMTIPLRAYGLIHVHLSSRMSGTTPNGGIVVSHAGVIGARALVDDALALIDDLTSEQWAADTACHGWRVFDVVTHLGFFINVIVDPAIVLPDNPSGISELLNDAAVRERADWSLTEVIDYYRAQSTVGLATLAALQDESMRDVPLTMGDLGTYRLAQLSDAVSFDHLVHLTSDLFAPFGPLPAVPVAIDKAIDPALDWMLAGLPQMNGDALLPVLARPIGLRLTGVSERSFLLARNDDGDKVVVVETDELPDDVATSSASDFLRWGTTRTAWRSAVTVTGEHSRVAAVLDAVNIV
jgi:uncharacterized protein (TIGR03083 family)